MYYLYNPHPVTIVNLQFRIATFTLYDRQYYLYNPPNVTFTNYDLVKDGSPRYLYNLWLMICSLYIVWYRYIAFAMVMHNNYFHSSRCYLPIDYLYNIFHVTCTMNCRVCCLWSRKSSLSMDTCTQGISWLTMECASKTYLHVSLIKNASSCLTVFISLERYLLSCFYKTFVICFSFFRIAGYENTFIGLKSKLSAMARRKLKDQLEAIDVLSFGKVSP